MRSACARSAATVAQAAGHLARRAAADACWRRSSHRRWPPDDPPGRVGRVTESQGQSWVYDTDAGEWINLERNRPLTTGDRLAVDGGGAPRAAHRFDRRAPGRRQRARDPPARRRAHRLCSCTTAAWPCACVRPRSRARSRWPPPRGASRRAAPATSGSTVATTRVWPPPGAATCSSRATTARSPFRPGRSAEFWREGANNATHYAWGEPRARRVRRLDGARQPRGRSSRARRATCRPR